MAEKRSKYDTDPLDPDFVRHTEEMRGATREVGRTANEQARQSETAEASTRRYQEPTASTPYPSVFDSTIRESPAASISSATKPVNAGGVPPPSSRTVPGIGLPENIAMMLPYTPFYIGGVVAALELFLVPRSEVRTRFHAAQGLALQLAILAAGFLFRIASFFVSSTLGGFSATLLSVLWSLFSVAALIFLIVSMVRVWKGEPHTLEPLADVTKRLNEQIEPRK